MSKHCCDDLKAKLALYIGVFQYEIYELTDCIQPHWWQFIERKRIKEEINRLYLQMNCYKHILNELPS